jgi:hypothetical protein
MPTPEEERPSQAVTERDEALARQAAAEAEKAELDTSEYKSADARAMREAERRQKVAEADRATADARRARVSSLLPDLAERGSLAVEAGEPILGSLVAHAALGAAADDVVAKVLPALEAAEIVILTSDSDLASSDGNYLDVKNGLDQLTAAADRLAAELSRAPDTVETASVGALTAAFAAALPSVLSLLSAHRSIATKVVTVNDIAALSAVAGRLQDKKKKVQLDDFRLVPDGGIANQVTQLHERRRCLVKIKLALDQTRISSETTRASLEEQLKELRTELSEARKAGKSVEQIQRKIESTTRERDSAATEGKDATVRVGLVDDALESIDTFGDALKTIPEGGKRSPLVSASLREQLHGTDPKASHLLLVKAASGSTAQVVDDRPFWFNDRFTVIGSVSVSFVLLDTDSRLVTAAGVATGTARVAGKIGSDVVVGQAKMD